MQLIFLTDIDGRPMCVLLVTMKHSLLIDFSRALFIEDSCALFSGMKQSGSFVGGCHYGDTGYIFVVMTTASPAQRVSIGSTSY